MFCERGLPLMFRVLVSRHHLQTVAFLSRPYLLLINDYCCSVNFEKFQTKIWSEATSIALTLCG
jgi:hypothetical protein